MRWEEGRKGRREVGSREVGSGVEWGIEEVAQWNLQNSTRGTSDFPGYAAASKNKSSKT